jgi:hypothetical protein
MLVVFYKYGILDITEKCKGSPEKGLTGEQSRWYKSDR